VRGFIEPTDGMALCLPLSRTEKRTRIVYCAWFVLLVYGVQNCLELGVPRSVFRVFLQIPDSKQHIGNVKRDIFVCSLVGFTTEHMYSLQWHFTPSADMGLACSIAFDETVFNGQMSFSERCARVVAVSRSVSLASRLASSACVFGLSCSGPFLLLRVLYRVYL
jgi:hypothetical protein